VVNLLNKIMDNLIEDLKLITKEILDNHLKKYKNDCPPNITDLVFLEIEKNYLKDYEIARKKKNEFAINTAIGKFIKQYWNLQNCGKCNSPISKLINSYTKHSN
jgi:hypothetical protein